MIKLSFVLMQMTFICFFFFKNSSLFVIIILRITMLLFFFWNLSIVTTLTKFVTEISRTWQISSMHSMYNVFCAWYSIMIVMLCWDFFNFSQYWCSSDTITLTLMTFILNRLVIFIVQISFITFKQTRIEQAKDRFIITASFTKLVNTKLKTMLCV